ncbi:MAG: FecR domain-containing protein [Leadbetterella sp.]|nr:FecR domain-containing protein [Leadbetterella sp.]
MHRSQARELLKKHREGTLTDDERVILESWYLRRARSLGLEAGRENIQAHLDSLPELPAREARRAVGKWLSAAAGILIVLGAGVWYMTRPVPVAPAPVLVNDALPGDNRARLILASGKDILLDEASSGELAREGNTSIVKTDQGELVYHTAQQAAENTTPSYYNTIETPKAGQYHIRLSDGTRVWLNAASSIRFPTQFSTHQRVVDVVGEVYFEVAKATTGGRRIPFKVVSGNLEVEVLGTRFNINSYSDEGVIRTTLLEGSIQVRTPKKEIVLQPGQQARVSGGQTLKVSQVNTGQVMAWKEGYFSFDGVGLKELMRQLSRWYDMEVVYEGNTPDYEFVGQISRNTRLSGVLQILEAGGVRFRVDGKKIIVSE